MLQAAVMAVIDGSSFKSAAKSFHINVMTLKRYVRKQKSQESDISYESNYKHSQIFSAKEDLLCEYLKTSSKLYHGLISMQLIKLAFQYAMNNDKKVPESWKAEECAGYYWYRNFMDRNKTLSLRTPEATSLNRAVSFNKHNANMLFVNLEKIYKEEKLDPHCVWKYRRNWFYYSTQATKNSSY
ncbi:hypothetical protein AVEN_184482-1 [Araneus ventricosus]|uniref:HTH psq-type domain-containing protein n=1 Tax=Araneus ventricosus TaxID=182803 RepID=A0A4Y2BHT0_ARAVE|nr:hypothetical protein AVEN_184482-1 [Araneus ventricosus]